MQYNIVHSRITMYRQMCVYVHKQNSLRWKFSFINVHTIEIISIRLYVCMSIFTPLYDTILTITIYSTSCWMERD